jgi:hypothetical protein
MGRTQISLADRQFPDKATVRRYCSSILSSQPVGGRLPDDIAKFLIAVIKHHPRALEKLGAGVRCLRVAAHPIYRSRMFVIERVDGTLTDFSFLDAIAGIGRPANDNDPTTPPPTSRRDFARAARNAIREQVEMFRTAAQLTSDDRLGHVRCAVSNRLLPIDECDVDHEAPWDFRSIVEAFVTERHVEIANVPIAGYGDGETERRFVDKAFAGDFARYHLARASLRIVARSIHRRISAAARRREVPQPQA